MNEGCDAAAESNDGLADSSLGHYSPFNDDRRLPTCVSCKHHGRVQFTRGHRTKCPYRECRCERCATHRVKLKRRVQAKQKPESAQFALTSGASGTASPDSSCRGDHHAASTLILSSSAASARSAIIGLASDSCGVPLHQPPIPPGLLNYNRGVRSVAAVKGVSVPLAVMTTVSTAASASLPLTWPRAAVGGKSVGFHGMPHLLGRPVAVASAVVTAAGGALRRRITSAGTSSCSTESATRLQQQQLFPVLRSVTPQQQAMLSASCSSAPSVRSLSSLTDSAAGSAVSALPRRLLISTDPGSMPTEQQLSLRSAEEPGGVALSREMVVTTTPSSSAAAIWSSTAALQLINVNSSMPSIVGQTAGGPGRTRKLAARRWVSSHPYLLPSYFYLDKRTAVTAGHRPSAELWPNGLGVAAAGGSVWNQITGLDAVLPPASTSTGPDDAATAAPAAAAGGQGDAPVSPPAMEDSVGASLERTTIDAVPRSEDGQGHPIDAVPRSEDGQGHPIDAVPRSEDGQGHPIDQDNPTTKQPSTSDTRHHLYNWLTSQVDATARPVPPTMEIRSALMLASCARSKQSPVKTQPTGSSPGDLRGTDDAEDLPLEVTREVGERTVAQVVPESTTVVPVTARLDENAFPDCQLCDARPQDLAPEKRSPAADMLLDVAGDPLCDPLCLAADSYSPTALDCSPNLSIPFSTIPQLRSSIKSDSSVILSQADVFDFSCTPWPPSSAVSPNAVTTRSRGTFPMAYDAQDAHPPEPIDYSPGSMTSSSFCSARMECCRRSGTVFSPVSSHHQQLIYPATSIDVGASMLQDFQSSSPAATVTSSNDQLPSYDSLCKSIVGDQPEQAGYGTAGLGSGFRPPISSQVGEYTSAGLLSPPNSGLWHDANRSSYMSSSLYTPMRYEAARPANNMILPHSYHYSPPPIGMGSVGPPSPSPSSFDWTALTPTSSSDWGMQPQLAHAPYHVSVPPHRSLPWSGSSAPTCTHHQDALPPSAHQSFPPSSGYNPTSLDASYHHYNPALWRYASPEYGGASQSIPTSAMQWPPNVTAAGDLMTPPGALSNDDLSMYASGSYVPTGVYGGGSFLPSSLRHGGSGYACSGDLPGNLNRSWIAFPATCGPSTCQSTPSFEQEFFSSICVPPLPPRVEPVEGQLTGGFAQGDLNDASAAAAMESSDEDIDESADEGEQEQTVWTSQGARIGEQVVDNNESLVDVTSLLGGDTLADRLVCSDKNSGGWQGYPESPTDAIAQDSSLEDAAQHLMDDPPIGCDVGSGDSGVSSSSSVHKERGGSFQKSEFPPNIKLEDHAGCGEDDVQTASQSVLVYAVVDTNEDDGAITREVVEDAPAMEVDDRSGLKTVEYFSKPLEQCTGSDDFELRYSASENSMEAVETPASACDSDILNTTAVQSAIGCTATLATPPMISAGVHPTAVDSAGTIDTRDGQCDPPEPDLTVDTNPTGSRQSPRNDSTACVDLRPVASTSQDSPQTAFSVLHNRLAAYAAERAQSRAPDFNAQEIEASLTLAGCLNAEDVKPCIAPTDGRRELSSDTSTCREDERKEDVVLKVGKRRGKYDDSSPCVEDIVLTSAAEVLTSISLLSKMSEDHDFVMHNS